MSANEIETVRLVLHYSLPGLLLFFAVTIGPWALAGLWQRRVEK